MTWIRLLGTGALTTGKAGDKSLQTDWIMISSCCVTLCQCPLPKLLILCNYGASRKGTCTAIWGQRLSVPSANFNLQGTAGSSTLCYWSRNHNARFIGFSFNYAWSDGLERLCSSSVIYECCKLLVGLYCSRSS